MIRQAAGLSKQTQRLIIVGVGFALVLTLVVSLLLIFRDNTSPLDRWTAQREGDLEAIAKRLADYAAAHNHSFPKDAKELAAAGIMTPEQARFHDPVHNVEVQRQYRPGSVPKDGNRIILILENYEPNPESQLLAVYSDCQVGVRLNLESTVSDDNGLRAFLKMPQIPWTPPPTP